MLASRGVAHAGRWSRLAYAPLYACRVDRRGYAPKPPLPLLPAKQPALPATNFLKATDVYEGKSLSELIRAALVMRLCSVDLLVDNSQGLLRWSYAWLGKGITNTLLKWTFFGHFCGGEKEEELSPVVDRLKKAGIGTIFDYAAENDVTEKKGSVVVKRDLAREGVVSARVYDYEGEDECDANLEMMLRSVDTAAATFEFPFVAIKLTALGKPQLLENVTKVLVTIRNLWANMAECHSSSLSRKDFSDALEKLGMRLSPEGHNEVFNTLDTLKDEQVDYIEWTSYLSLDSMINSGMLSAASYTDTVFSESNLLPLLDDNDTELLRRMMRRVNTVAQAAADKKVRLLIDAEQTYVQSAIDHITLILQRQHNRDFPVIFNTYQAYLSYTQQRIINDLERSKRENFFFAGKLVRGAYLVLETKRSKVFNTVNPIFPTIEETHASYDGSMELLLSNIDRVNVMLATHNTNSIQLAVQLMEEKKIDPRGGQVFFGQLLGMADELSFPLGRNGFQAYKYVPYGPVDEVVPYLVRRAQENKDMMKQSSQTIRNIRKEIFKRLLPWK